jgi:hypothetical protein
MPARQGVAAAPFFLYINRKILIIPVRFHREVPWFFRRSPVQATFETPQLQTGQIGHLVPGTDPILKHPFPITEKECAVSMEIARGLSRKASSWWPVRFPGTAEKGGTVMGFFDRILGQKDQTTYVSRSGGFQLSHPPDWLAEERQDGVALHPPANGKVIDPEYGVEIPVPGIFVTVRTVEGQVIPDIKELLRGRGDTYESYRVIDHISNEVPKADRAIVYEFGFASGGAAYRAVSAIAVKGKRLYDVKACDRASNFDALRKTFRQSVKGFKIE